MVPGAPPEAPPIFRGYPRKPKFLDFSFRNMFPGVPKQSSLSQNHSNLENLQLKTSWSDVDEENSVLVPPETCFLRKSQGILVSGGTPGNCVRGYPRKRVSGGTPDDSGGTPGIPGIHWIECKDWSKRAGGIISFPWKLRVHTFQIYKWGHRGEIWGRNKDIAYCKRAVNPRNSGGTPGNTLPGVPPDAISWGTPGNQISLTFP